MKKRRILVLMHQDLIPPDDLDGFSDQEISEWKTEYDVSVSIEHLGHELLKLGISDELRPIRMAIREGKPDIVFNLLEEFRGEAIYDQNVVAYIELLGVPYTGCNPRGLVLSRDKALMKQLLAYHRIRCPGFAVFPVRRKVAKPKRLEYPLIVKAVDEDASLGISKASVVYDHQKLTERVQFVHESVGSGAIAEEFIVGHDVYVGVLGNDRLQVLPPQQLCFQRKPDDELLIATAKAKHDVAYQEKWGIDLKPARGLDSRKVAHLCKRIYRTLRLDGYARLDFRMNEKGDLFFLEANANPDLARFEEFASAAEQAGIDYDALITRVLNLGLQRGGRRR